MLKSIIACALAVSGSAAFAKGASVSAARASVSTARPSASVVRTTASKPNARTSKTPTTIYRSRSDDDVKCITLKNSRYTADREVYKRYC